MVESGGTGRPRPDNEQSAEHPATPASPATDLAQTPDPGTSDPGTPDADPAPTPSEAPEPARAAPAEAAPDGGDAPQGPPAPGDDHRTTGANSDDESETETGSGAETEAGTGTRAEPGTRAETGTRAEAGTRSGADTEAGRPASPAPAPVPTLPKGPPPQRPPEQPRGGLLMGRPFGVPVYVAPSWFLVAALITWVFGNQLDRVLPELGALRYLVSLFFAVAFYASVLIHELAHTIAALRFKLPVRRIQLQFFGGVSEIEKEAETPGREFWLAFVGPLLSLVLAGVFYLAMQPVEPGTVPGVLLAGLMISNLIVAIFNLLPGLPLDGGRMLRAVVWKLTGKPMNGTIAAAWVGRALAVSVLIGLPLLTQSGALGSSAEDSVGMDTVTDALLAAILAAIIWTGAGNSLRMARLREHLPELRARTLTRRAVPVETHTPLSEALRRANDAGARALVVVDAHGEPLSLVREAAIVGVPEHRRPWVAVSGLAQDLTEGMRVSAELAGEDLLDVLRATPATEYLVVEETGEIFGVLSAADVERAFVKAMARPS
ncbi:site-2 protease family protein [Streptomyces sp. Root1310]|uniref:site-2 protease family protein n=1 Tax=Streptomyces sp. Root1310 TaxID=1736452 RepID=UPI00070A850C|nr:site-2 protease family protein [Streptomyces sp. Root1310]KQX61090.1 peptidase [Streptomyces sp. Root1310]